MIHNAENGLHVWPPADWCAAINPARTHICDQPRGHEGDHSGRVMPTVTLDEPTPPLPPSSSNPSEETA